MPNAQSSKAQIAGSATGLTQVKTESIGQKNEKTKKESYDQYLDQILEDVGELPS